MKFLCLFRKEFLSERSFWRRKYKGERTSFYHLSKESVLIWCAWDLVCVRYTNNAWRSMTSFVRTGICILAFLHQNESELFPLQTKTVLPVIYSRTFMFGGNQARLQTIIHDPLYLNAVFSLHLTLCHLHISVKHCKCHIESKDLQVESTCLITL